jgi:hypothetical protein
MSDTIEAVIAIGIFIAAITWLVRILNQSNQRYEAQFQPGKKFDVGQIGWGDSKLERFNLDPGTAVATLVFSHYTSTQMMIVFTEVNVLVNGAETLQADREVWLSRPVLEQHHDCYSFRVLELYEIEPFLEFTYKSAVWG